MLSKRLFDFIFALIGLVLLFPLFVLIACWIKFDSPGSVFFRQERVGLQGKIFRIFKFRTMVNNAETKGQITIGHDSRITHAGFVLRRYKIDELPQLMNVLIGDMSFVGPRPEVPKYVDCYPGTVRDIVLSVKPGITDWASIRYRDENSVLGKAIDPERTYVEEILPIKLDYYVNYVKKRNFFMDLNILLSTIIAIVK